MSTVLEYQTPGRKTWRPDYLYAVLSWTALFVAFIYFMFRGPIFPNGQRLWDYAVCASSSYLWVRGEDPFSWDAVKTSWLDRGSAPGITNDIKWLYAIVPPTTLAVLSPFAALPVAVGAYLYLLVTTILTGISVWLSGKWAKLNGENVWRLYIAAVFVSVPASLGLYSGNPTMLAAPLLMIGSYLIATSPSRVREVCGGVLIGIGVACKLQIGLPVLAFWLVWGRWRAATAAMVVTAGIAGLAVGRLAIADVEWLASWIENVRTTNAAGGLNDYVAAKNPDDLVNLQVPLYRLIGDREYTDRLTLALWASLGLILALKMFRPVARRGLELATYSAVGLLTLIPVYHRTYDSIILLPLVALTFAMLAANRRSWFGWISLLLLVSLVVPAGLPNYLTKRQFIPPIEVTGFWASLFIGHKGWCIMGLAVLWILGIWLTKSERAEVDVQEKS